MLKDVDDHKTKIDKLKDKSEDLKENSEVDQQTVSDDFEDITDRYERIGFSVDERLKQLNKLQDAVHRYNENIEPVKELFDKVDSVIDEQPSYGVDEDKIKKEIAKIEVCRMQFLFAIHCMKFTKLH